VYALAGACCVGTAVAQTYPSKPVRILVGFAPGGAVDISARVVAQKLAETIGQPVVVDNRPGASGNIAADLTAKAPPDGHTLLVANVTIAMPSLFAKLPFDVKRDLAPVSLIAIGPSVLVVHPSVPVRSVKELIARAPGCSSRSTSDSIRSSRASEIFVPSGPKNLIPLSA
jgi:tripartite-type tricarboxylate transporter receptor subunit TctC